MSTDTTAPAPALAVGDTAYAVNAKVRVTITEVRRHHVTGQLFGYVAEVTDEDAPEGDDGREIELRADELAALRQVASDHEQAAAAQPSADTLTLPAWEVRGLRELVAQATPGRGPDAQAAAWQLVGYVSAVLDAKR